MDTAAEKTTASPRAWSTLLRGDPGAPREPQERHNGFHPVEWLCECVGTAFQLFLGFTVVGLLEAPGSPGRETIASPGARLVLIGMAFGVLAAVVATSPVGRRSGAHLNPAVTVGFWRRGHTSGSDLVGFTVAQILGALTAATGFAAAWSAWARGTDTARTAPAAGFPVWGAAGVEAALTCGLLLVVFTMVSSPTTARWTPVAVTGALSGLIWAGAPVTGASMNPARTIGPDVVAGGYPALWVYLVGPPLGALAAAALFGVVARERQTLTAKLFHDPNYPTVHRSLLPAKAHPGPVHRGHNDARVR